MYELGWEYFKIKAGHIYAVIYKKVNVHIGSGPKLIP